MTTITNSQIAAEMREIADVLKDALTGPADQRQRLIDNAVRQFTDLTNTISQTATSVSPAAQ